MCIYFLRYVRKPKYVATYLYMFAKIWGKFWENNHQTDHISFLQG